MHHSGWIWELLALVGEFKGSETVSSGPYIITCSYMLYTKYLSSPIVWLHSAFCWKNSPWTSSTNEIRLHLSYFKTLNYFSLFLVSWGGGQGARVSVGWTPFPVTRLDMAVLFWALPVERWLDCASWPQTPCGPVFIILHIDPWSVAWFVLWVCLKDSCLYLELRVD